jgi:hypothetical protein
VIVQREEIHTAIIVKLSYNAVGIALMAMLMISPLTWNTKILTVSAVLFFTSSIDWLVVAMKLYKLEALATSWFNHLTLRMAIDTFIENSRSGEPQTIDWSDASLKAQRDIGSAHRDDKLLGQLAGDDVVPNLLKVGAIACTLAARVLLAFGLAYAIRGVLPELVSWVSSSS